jgi:uncharacterized protein
MWRNNFGRTDVSPGRSIGFRLMVLLPLLFLAVFTTVSSGSAQAAVTVADWRMLAGLDYNTGEMTPALSQANGKRVRVPGYMVPLDDSASGVDEFILVPYYGACIHTPPPPPNQMVYVKMNGGRRVEVNMWEPIWIEGELRVSQIDSPYGAVGHQIAGLTVIPYSF